MSRAGIGLALVLALAAPDARGQGATRGADAPTRVYGIQIETHRGRERVLIFAEAELERQVEGPRGGRLRIQLLKSVLDDTAPRNVVPTVEGAIRSVQVRELEVDGVQAVEVEVAHAEGLSPEVTSQGAIVAVEFPAFLRPDTQGFALHFDDEDLSTVVDTLGRETGERFIYDGRLRGSATIIAPDRVSADEALALLDAALYMRGFAAVRGPEDVRKILPIAEAITEAPWDPEAPASEREAPVTTLVRLERADLDEVVRALAPNLGPRALAVPLYESRSVLLSGSEAQLHRWVSLAQALDRADAEEVRVFRLRERPAGEVAPLLVGLVEAGNVGPPASHRVTIAVDERSNALVVRAPPERLPEIRAAIRDLDALREGSGEIRVLRLHHADPETIADHLRALAGGEASAADADSLSGLVVSVHEETSSLVVRASAEGHELVQDVIRALDRRTPQVAVEVTVVEIRMREDQELGLHYFVALGDPESDASDVIGTISRIPEGGFPDIIQNPTIDPAFAGRVRGKEVGFPISTPQGPAEVLFPLHQVLVTAEATDAQSRILMRPHFVAANGEEQEFFVGDVVPIPVAADNAQEGSLLISTDIQRQDVGLELRVKPSIGEAGGVDLTLELDVTDVDQSAPDDLGPTLLQRRLRANAYLRDGEFAVIGFSARNVDARSDDRAPFFGDLPLVGWLFGSEDERAERQYFVVAAQATILRDAEEQLAASIRARLALERSLARVGDLRGAHGVRYAVLVATRSGAEAAEQVARQLPVQGEEEARINGWSFGGRNRFDVLVTGYRSMAQAGRALQRFAQTGLRPRVVAIPAPPDEEG